jgi:hypothetical protein
VLAGDAPHCAFRHTRVRSPSAPESCGAVPQAKRLEELDALYRDEALMRKKIFNQMEDMKGKIRVYCRVRPILQMEKDRGQSGAQGCGKGRRE